ncbi:MULTISPECIES: IclR family transcriptional regulator [unclassified Haladaptatus]|uniref:IclR family transcriptional regulator n=1 Tax=unclassified Haladaptatus TaxID=2622732 RepID=UPI00209C5D24|nr:MULTISPECIES: IclR family transcriptional regulator [unclassified Haladaptatus]MCO8245484.1 IclR family transcriptional regulator [Haladaptatus sp. AB643]MCO8256596.1 IclR family transcriptional regulator [Haladaptatus sp. AB618]
MKGKNKPKRIKASARSLSVLEALMTLGQASETEISEHLDMAKSTTHYHLTTLASHEFVVKEGANYRLSMRFLNMGHSTIDQLDIYQVGKHKIDQLAKETGELCILMIEERGYGYYVYDAQGTNAVNFDTTGSQKYLHDNALGKSVLAHLPAERIDEIIDRHGLPATTPHTITDRSKLEAELETIRERDIAFDREEQLEGLCCVATAIQPSNEDGSKGVYGSISIAGPASRMKGDYFTENLAMAVSDTANLIELEMRDY